MMPLTDSQRYALPFLRAGLSALMIPYGTVESPEQRARLPDPGSLPPDVTVRVEIAPPSSTPDPVLENTGALKALERVPVYFFSLNNESSSDSQNQDGIADTRVIFWMHGGGGVTGHPTFERFTQYFVQILRAVASRSGGAAKCIFIAPSYRLATVPENAFPAALQDVLAAYDHVLGKGYKPSNIVLAGDSAGGNLAVVLTHLILQSGRPCPDGIVAVAPASIQSQDHMSDYAKSVAEQDIVSLDMGKQMTSAYVGESGVEPANPLVSGSFLPFTAAWPRTLILVGSSDMLIDASRELEKRLVALGRPVELVEYDERPHGWWGIAQVFPEEIRDSSERIARFVLE